VTADGQGGSATETGKLQHRAFDIVVLLKGLNGVLELFGGFALIFISNAEILGWAFMITRNEISEDPNDFLANSLLHWAESFGRDSRLFVAFYLLFHGVAKISLATMLMRGASWAYPAAMTFFSVFIAYSAYRLSLGWSLPLAGFVLLDALTVWLIGREWGMRNGKSND
jgi:uncharacterized membrane protein